MSTMNDSSEEISKTTNRPFLWPLHLAEMDQVPSETEAMAVDNEKTVNSIGIHSSDSEEEIKAMSIGSETNHSSGSEEEPNSMSIGSETKFDGILVSFESGSDFKYRSDDEEDYVEVTISAETQIEELNGRIIYPKPGEKVQPLIASKRATTKYSQINYDLKDFDGIKITSWSICGAQNFIEKDGLEFIKHEKSDIFCLQDFNCSVQEFQKFKSRFVLDGYSHHWLLGDGTEEVRTRGLGILTKIKPTFQKHCQTGVALLDDEKTIFITEFEEFMLLNVTSPNAGFGLVHLQKKLLWHDSFNKFIEQLTEVENSKPVIIVGNLQTSIEEIGKFLHSLIIIINVAS